MSRIEKRFQELKQAGRTGFIAYVTAGCPELETTMQTVFALEKAGADVIELGIPFSDPMADGPVIQKAANLALQAGTTTLKVLDLVKNIRKTSQVPLVIMTYVNPILNMGVEKFVTSFAQAGLDGIIVPDLPLEESGLLSKICQEVGMDLIQLVAPTTTPDRMTAICKKVQGFVYCVSNTGVTGVRDIDYSTLSPMLNMVRAETKVPLAIGFGIGTPKGAQQAGKHADAVIVGSAIMELLMDGGVDAVEIFAKSIRKALDEGM
jgi:tryptophan synthase alpha chain